MDLPLLSSIISSPYANSQPPIINNIIKLNIVIILSESCNGSIRGGRRGSGNEDNGWTGGCSSGSRVGLCGSGMRWRSRAHDNITKTGVTIIGGLPHLIALACCTFTTGINCRSTIVLRGITASMVITPATSAPTSAAMPAAAATTTMITTMTRPTTSRENNWHGREVRARDGAINCAVEE